MSTSTTNYRLELLNVSKGFPGVQALTDVTVRVLPAEIHALVGENGAGKSTLMKILSGAYRRDAGRILLDGQEIEIDSPRQALQHGIVTIYQESNLAHELSVAENIYLGRLPLKAGLWVRWSQLYDNTQVLLDQLGASFTPRTPVKELSPAQRQMVEIAKALSISARVIVLDEPTAALTGREVDVLFDVIRRLRDRGVSTIFISHRLAEVFAIADRVTVLRDGCWVSTNRVQDVTEDTLVMHMVGRQVENLYARKAAQPGPIILRVRNLSGKGFHNVSFDLRSGEIVGLFGLVGSGRTEMVRALFGAEPPASGTVELLGNPHKPRSPKDAIRTGLALAPEDRKLEGLVLDLPVRANISLPNLRQVTRLSFISARRERSMANHFVQALDIRCPSVETPAQSLSGGNQQKVVIAKWLAREPRILILDEPTRGIDVAGKAEVHHLMGNLAAQGVGILMVSSDLPEVLGASDRILVMREGTLAGELPRQQASEEMVMHLAAGQQKTA